MSRWLHAGLLLGKADAGKRRIGEGHRGHQPGFLVKGQAVEDGARDIVGLVLGAARQRRAGNRVADGIDPAVGGLEEPVDGDAGPVVHDAGGIEAEAVDPRRAAGLDQEVRAVDRDLALGGDRARRECRSRSGRRWRSWHCRGSDTLGAEPIEDDRRELGVLAGKRRFLVEHGRGDAEPVVGLRQLEGAGIGAEDDKVGRFVGELEGGCRRSGSRPHRGRRASAGRATAPVAITVRRARIVVSPAITVRRSAKRAAAGDDRHAERRQPLRRDRRGDGDADRGDMVAELGEIDLRAARR